MKIGVLSSFAYICNVNNYGSLLQYFALQTYLTQEGHEVYWIRFNKISKQNSHILRYIKSKILGSNYKIPSEHFNKKDFDIFIDQYIKLSDCEYFNYKEIKRNPPIADLYIVGSDQIWNGYSPERYLMFIPHNKPKISYAVSFGKTTIKRYLMPLMWYYLKGFKAISVREEIGIKICNKLGRKDAKYVIDPTFLLSKNDYIKFIKNENIKSENEPYIFSYFVNPFFNNIFPFEEEYEDFKKKTNCKLIITAIQGAENAFDGSLIKNPPPLKWIELIANANYVLTNSFHGVAFSIIMRKQFLLLPQNGIGKVQNNRQINLLKTLGLNDRIYSEHDSILKQIQSPIKWDKIQHKINQFIDLSKFFLLENLNCK